MNRIILRIGLGFWVGVSCLINSAAAENYDCAFELTEGKRSLRSVALTKEVYECFQFSNYKDLSVTNADGQAVPFRLGAAPSRVAQREHKKSIEFYNEPVPSSYRTAEQVERIAALTGIVSRNIDDIQWQSTNVHFSSLILRQPNKTDETPIGQLQSLNLDIDATQESIRATIIVEVSDDLQRWKTLSKPHNLYLLQGESNRLSKSTLNLSHAYSQNSKYLRLAILSNLEGFTSRLRSITGSYRYTEHHAAPMQWLTVEPHKVSDEENSWEVELPGLLPVSAIRFRNANNIVYYKGTIYSQVHKNPKAKKENARVEGRHKLKKVLKDAARGRSKNDDQSPQYRTSARFSHYELDTQDGFIISPDIQFSDSSSSRVWKFRFDAPASLNLQQLPEIEFGWHPQRLSYVAQGGGPFTLLVGSDQVAKKVIFPSQLQGYSETMEEVGISTSKPVHSDKEPVAKISDDDISKSNPLSLLLWAMLILGVGIMFYMAYSLTQTMNDPEDIDNERKGG